MAASIQTNARPDLDIDSAVGVARLKANDADAWRCFQERYRHLFAHIARHHINTRVLGSKDDIDEVVSITIEECYASIGRYEPGSGTLAAWSGCICTRKAIDYHRKLSRIRGKEVMFEAELIQEMFASTHWRMDDQLCLKEFVRRLEQEFGHDDNFESFVKCYVSGETVKEVAKELGLAPNTLTQRLQRLRGRIKERHGDSRWLFALCSLLLMMAFLLWLMASILRPPERHIGDELREVPTLFEPDMGLLDTLCGEGDGESCWEWGRAKALKGDLVRGAPRLEQACRMGFTSSCRDVGILKLMEGWTQDVANGLSILERACEDGSGAACTDLGHMIHTGAANFGIGQDLDRGVELIERGHALGHASLSLWRTYPLMYMSDQCQGGNVVACGVTTWRSMERLRTDPHDAQARVAIITGLEGECQVRFSSACFYKFAFRADDVAGSSFISESLPLLAMNVGQVPIRLDTDNDQGHLSWNSITLKNGDSKSYAAIKCGTGAECYEEGQRARSAYPTQARKLYIRSCEQGYSKGCAELERMRELDPRPVEQSRPMALAARSCGRGHTTACRILGRMLEGPAKASK